MAPNKDRVYIALYVRAGVPKMPGREDTYVKDNRLTSYRGNPCTQ